MYHANSTNHTEYLYKIIGMNIVISNKDTIDCNTE